MIIDKVDLNIFKSAVGQGLTKYKQYSLTFKVYSYTLFYRLFPF